MYGPNYDFQENGMKYIQVLRKLELLLANNKTKS